MQNRRWGVGGLLFLSVATVVTVAFFPAIPQDPAYHNFADTRPFFGIPNFGDVVSSFPFVILGAWGLWFVAKRRRQPEKFLFAQEPRLWGVFFLGVFLVGFGSGYYHWNPTNETLVWDRLPIPVVLMSLFAYVIAERVGETVGRRLFPFLVLFGAGSVFYWHYTETIGRGDLRPYAVAQFFPMLAIALLLLIFPRRGTGARRLWGAFAWNVVSKACEYFDGEIFELLGSTVSGHTLKHLTAALAAFWVLEYLRVRKVLSQPTEETGGATLSPPD